MKAYVPHFARIARRVGPSLARSELEAVAGSWLGSSALKVQKRSWSGITKATAPGIFFSVWVDEKARSENRALYNIHALKLRSLSGYSIQSRDFATAFRRRFSAQKKSWPHVSVNHGPQTLMQGWIALDPARLEDDVEQLIERFIPLAAMLDDLLAERKVS